MGVQRDTMADMLTVNRTATPGDSLGFLRMFAPGRFTLGKFFPIEDYAGEQPTMIGQETLPRLDALQEDGE